MATQSRRKIAARKPVDYDSRTDGKREGRMPGDDRCLNAKLCTVNLVRPDGKKGKLVFQASPELDYEEPGDILQPGRLSAEPGSYSRWMIRIRSANYIGLPNCPKFTFLLFAPKDKQEKRNTNPYNVFYFACKQAETSGRFGTGKKWDSDWNKFMKGAKGHGAAISAPNAKFFLQGGVYLNGETNYMVGKRKYALGFAPDDDLTVIELSGSAGDAITELCDMRLASFDGDEEKDFSVGFKYGDPVGYFSRKRREIQDSPFYTIFDPRHVKVEKNTSWNGEIAEMQGYEAAIARRLVIDQQEFTGDLDNTVVEQIFEKSQFWLDSEPGKEDGLLRIASDEEQASWVAQAYKDEPKLLLFAWAEHDHFMTAEVKAILASRTSAAMPGRDDEDDEEDTRSRRRTRQDPTARGRDDDEDALRGRSRDDDDDRPRRARDDDDAPRRARNDDDDDRPRRARTDDDDDRTRRSRDDADDGDAPRGRSRDDERDEFEDAPRGRSKPAADDDAPRRSRARDDDEDDRPARARSRDDDDDRPRRARPRDDDEEARPRRARTDDDDETPRRAAARDDDDDARPRRARRDDDDDDAPRGRGRANDDDDAPRRSRARDDDDDRDAPRGRSRADDDDATPRRRSRDEDDEDSGKRDEPVGKKTEKDDYGFDDDEPAGKGKEKESPARSLREAEDTPAASDAKTRSRKRKTADAEAPAAPKARGGSASRKK